MKYLAAFLVMILMLSVSGPRIAGVRKNCQSAIKSCHINCCKEAKKPLKGDCSKTGCVCITSCFNGSFIQSVVAYNSSFTTDSSDKHHNLFVIGGLSDYNHNNWNPPKA